MLPVSLRPPKDQRVNPRSLRSLGIPETPDRKAGSWTGGEREDDWIAAAHVPEPSIAGNERRTPPVAAVTDIDEAATVAAAAAARKGRKPKVIRTVACEDNIKGGPQGVGLRSTK